jgi:DNA-binding transcriptional ArsR family regulator
LQRDPKQQRNRIQGNCCLKKTSDDESEKIAEFAGIFSDASRVKIITLLMQERQGMTTMDISTRLGLLQPRVSSHLSILLGHGIVSVADIGRQRIYTIGSKKIISLLKALATLSIPSKQTTFLVSPGAIKEVRNNSAIRQCRSCYDHLAGVAGVELLEEMLRSRWLLKDPNLQKRQDDKTYYQLTKFGTKSLMERGVDVDQARESDRTFAYGCIDWTERQPHLGGSLGSAVLNSILSEGIIERKPRTRALKLVKPIASWLKPSK